jgi:ABC-type Fe3+/spermidine/putrescine transport system ATPase subunit
MHITINGVHKAFGSKQVLRNISLQVEKGKFIVLLGPSGCGKTTLLNILAGVHDIDEGEIFVGGRLYSAKGFTMPSELRNIGMIFQDFALWPHMTVFDNVAFGLKVKRLPTKVLNNQVEEVLRLVQMEPYAGYYVHQLSGGQKQRIAIARALVVRPEVLLLDEPFSNLDTGLREQMRWDLLRIIHEAGITAVYVTHDQEEALSMADEIVLLNEGLIRQSGTPAALYRHPDSVFAASFLGAANLLPATVNGTGDVTAQWNGFKTQISVLEGKPGEEVTILFRPGDIMPISDSIKPTGLSFAAKIKRRAFHGHVWKYRVEIIAHDPQVLEVWNAEEWPLDLWMEFSVMAQACHLIRESWEA